MDGEGEKWTIVEMEPNLIRIKGLGGERDMFLGHDNDQNFMVDRADAHE